MAAKELKEIILEVWRREIRMVANPQKWVITVWPADKVQDLAEALKAAKPELMRRLQKPKGWPRYEPFPPPWWDRIALGFEIAQARLRECARCGYPVSVLVENCQQPGWYCPKCGKPSNLKGNGHASKRSLSASTT
jgi:hypothetical protein